LLASAGVNLERSRTRSFMAPSKASGGREGFSFSMAGQRREARITSPLVSLPKGLGPESNSANPS